MYTIREDCLNDIMEYLMTIEWKTQDFYKTGEHDGYFVVPLPNKQRFIECVAEWVCGRGKDSREYFSTKKAIMLLPNILVYIYIQQDDPQDAPYIIEALFDIACDRYTPSISFVEELTPDVIKKILNKELFM